MYQYICLDPTIFHKDNTNEFISLAKDILINGILMFDENDELDSKYREVIEKLDFEEKKFFEAWYIYLTNNLVSSRQKNIGNIDIKDFENAILKKVKSYKVIKSYFNDNFKEINKEYFILVITSNKNTKAENLLKQKFSFPIENYTFSEVNRKFEDMNNGILIKGKNVNDVIFNYILPILWYSEEICFFTKEISTPSKRFRKDNKDKFKILFNKILEIFQKVKKIDKPIIKIISGSDNAETQLEFHEFVQELKKNNLDFQLKEVMHKDENRYVDLHPRAIYADGLCINFEKSPEFDEEDSDFFDNSYNRILIDKVFADYIKSENLDKNI